MPAQTTCATRTGPAIPDALKVTPAEKLLFTTRGKGVQIYEWVPKQDDPNQYEWVHTPEADLFNSQGEKIGCHYGGPTWESNDGSKVVCDLKAHVASKDKGAAPWLLLIAKTHQGQGAFSRVTSIQRLETVGGGEPPTGTGQAKEGQTVRVPYTATYYFYGPKS